MTVAARFQTLLGRLQPTEREVETYNGHIKTVTTRLRTTFGDMQTKVIGSYARDTAIHGRSDVDLMAVLPVSEVRWGNRVITSKQALDKVRAALQDRYTATGIRRDGQAVVVGFGQGTYSVDVVPAVFDSFSVQRRPIYGIPDGSGGWMLTSPESHAKYLDDANQRSGHKLQYTAQLLKFWRTCWADEIPLQSFHVELLLASTDICVGVKSYASCLFEAFDALGRRGCRALQDPVGISGLIPVAGTSAKLERTLAAVIVGRENAQKAINAERLGSLAQAYTFWDRAFNGCFPKQ